MTPETAIETRELSRSFGRTVALDGLDIRIPRGEIFGFLGHNGAGKTTTIRLLNGVLEPTRGSCTVLGLDPTERGPTLRRRTGVLTETPSLDDRLTARETLGLHAEYFDLPLSSVRTRITKLLETFDLADRADERLGGYSRGMKQRLALARALLSDPEILFLDEPTSSLDPVATRRVHDLIQSASREEGRTVFLCTHNMTEAARLCDRVAVLEYGRLSLEGNPDELRRTLERDLSVHLEVSGTQWERARDLLSQRWSVRPEPAETIWIDGITREDIPAIIHQLSRDAISIYRVEPSEPSLEEVYLSIHRRDERS